MLRSVVVIDRQYSPFHCPEISIPNPLLRRRIEADGFVVDVQRLQHKLHGKFLRYAGQSMFWITKRERPCLILCLLDLLSLIILVTPYVLSRDGLLHIILVLRNWLLVIESPSRSILLGSLSPSCQTTHLGHTLLGTRKDFIGCFLADETPLDDESFQLCVFVRRLDSQGLTCVVEFIP